MEKKILKNNKVIKLVILDRDGVINKDSSGYIKSPDEFYFIKNSPEAIARLHEAGIKIAVATNQSGIARGYFDHAMLARIHQKMITGIQQAGGLIDWIYYCPHHPKDGCACRKPKPGMLIEVCQKASIALDEAVMVGDKATDMEAAFYAGIKSIWITPTVSDFKKPLPSPWAAFPDLFSMVDALL